VFVLLETNHGSYRLEGDEGDTIKSVLGRFGVPLSAVWTYRLESQDDLTGLPTARRVHFVPARTRLGDDALDGCEIYARLTRNINIPGLIGLDTQSVHPVDNPTTEWTFPARASGAFGQVECQLAAEECFRLVCESVEEVLDAWPDGLPRRLVVGTSGGGDSNVLLSALMRSEKLPAEEIVPVMMLGIPDWDTQVGNAREICQSLGVELRIIEGEEAVRLAGVRDFDALKASFVESYPDADLEFLGTWLLRKVLGGYAHEQGISAVATGANREDIIAEGFARLARGGEG